MDNITKDQFLAFERVRRSGICNMFDTSTIMEVTNLTSEEISEIRNNYSELADKYLPTKSTP